MRNIRISGDGAPEPQIHGALSIFYILPPGRKNILFLLRKKGNTNSKSLLQTVNYEP